VESEGIIEVEIVRSADPYITVITDDNIVGDVLTDITGSSLLISLRDANYSNVSVAVSVGMPAVTSVENDGTGAIITRVCHLSMLLSPVWAVLEMAISPAMISLPVIGH